MGDELLDWRGSPVFVGGFVYYSGNSTGMNYGVVQEIGPEPPYYQGARPIKVKRLANSWGATESNDGGRWTYLDRIVMVPDIESAKAEAYEQGVQDALLNAEQNGIDP